VGPTPRSALNAGTMTAIHCSASRSRTTLLPLALRFTGASCVVQTGIGMSRREWTSRCEFTAGALQADPKKSGVAASR